MLIVGFPQLGMLRLLLRQRLVRLFEHVSELGQVSSQKLALLSVHLRLILRLLLPPPLYEANFRRILPLLGRSSSLLWFHHIGGLLTGGKWHSSKKAIEPIHLYQ